MGEGNDENRSIWDRIGYKRLLLALLIAFGIWPAGAGIFYLARPSDFAELNTYKVAALSAALVAPFLVVSIVVGALLAYICFYDPMKAQPKKGYYGGYEDRIARLIMFGGSLASACAANLCFLLIASGQPIKTAVLASFVAALLIALVLDGFLFYKVVYRDAYR